MLSSIYKCNRKEDEKLVNSSVVEQRQNIWKPINSFKKNKYFWFITTANKSLVAIRVLDVRLLPKSSIKWYINNDLYIYIHIPVCKLFPNSYVVIVKMNHDGALISDRKLMMSMIKHWKYSHRGIWRQHNLRISVVSNIIKQKLWIISNHYNIWKCYTLFTDFDQLHHIDTYEYRNG